VAQQAEGEERRTNAPREARRITEQRDDKRLCPVAVFAPVFASFFHVHFLLALASVLARWAQRRGLPKLLRATAG
jgi:hypothetical protein